MSGWLLEPLRHGFTLRALAELALLGVVGGVIGCWIILHRISFSAESLAHAMFPGLVGAALLGVPLLLGGTVGVLVAGLLITLVARLAGESADTAIAVVVTSLFGLGVLLALSPATPPGVQSLLFGDPLAASSRDLLMTAALGLLVLAVLWRSHDRLLAIGFDPGTSRIPGLSPGLAQALLSTLVALSVLIGVQVLGNLLVAAILVGPAATARLLTERVRSMMVFSVAVAVGAGVAGIYLSFHARIAAGAAVVVALAVFYLVAAGVAALKASGPPSGSRARPVARTSADVAGRSLVDGAET